MIKPNTIFYSKLVGWSNWQAQYNSIKPKTYDDLVLVESEAEFEDIDSIEEVEGYASAI